MDTIEQAFLEPRTRARIAEVRALTTMDGMDLDKPEVMAQAWRPVEWVVTRGSVA